MTEKLLPNTHLETLDDVVEIKEDGVKYHNKIDIL